ncbi:hypothetical protein BJX61DRAFT_542152 [Aspergillus egyptiacus]|nr:hypothetical protein BJX61DRAFT_542152 [Aspergillus egyptiacus]
MYLDLYIGRGHIQPPFLQPHWFLAISPQSESESESQSQSQNLNAPSSKSTCTIYHVSGGPTNYRHVTQIRPSTALLHNSHSDNNIAALTYIGTIYAAQQKLVYGITRAVPPTRCHWYILEVLMNLEQMGLVAPAVVEGFWALLRETVPLSGFQVAVREWGWEGERAVWYFLDLAKRVDLEQGQDKGGGIEDGNGDGDGVWKSSTVNAE